MIVLLPFYLTGSDRGGRDAVARPLADPIRFCTAVRPGGPGAPGPHVGCRLGPWRTVVPEVRCRDEALLLRRAGYRGIRVKPADTGRAHVRAARLRGDPPALPVDWVLRHAPGAQGQAAKAVQ